MTWASAVVLTHGLVSHVVAQTEITPVASAVIASANDGNLPANTVDSNLATRWSANGDGQWLEVDLGTVRTVALVKVASYLGNTRSNRFDIQVSTASGGWSNVLTAAQSSGTTTGLETFDFLDVSARWVRYLGHGNTVNAWNSVTEIEVWAPAATPAATPTPTPTPEATPTATPGATPSPSYVEVTPAASAVTASTSDTNGPGNAVDSSLATRWAGNGDGAWLKLDLGSARALGYVKIAFYNGNTRQARFDLQVSADNASWSNVLTGALSGGATTQEEAFDFADVPGRYVRYVGHGNTSASPASATWNSLLEVSVFGVPCASCPTPTPSATPTPSPTPAPGGFRHPGVINSRESLDFVKAKIAAGAQPWKAAYDALVADSLASLARNPTPFAVVACGPYENPNDGCTEEYSDSAAAYANALLWYYTGSTARAQKAIQYMDAWSAVVTDHTDHNARLQAGWAAANWTKAAEIIRHTGGGWSSTGISRFRTMLLNVYYPEIQAGGPGSLNGNWELAMIDGIVGIGVFCDDKPKYDKAIAMWRARVPAYAYITTDGSTPKQPPGGVSSISSFWYNPGFYPEGLGQETCRDLAHLTLGGAALLYTAETALLQGTDLYTEQSRRIRATVEFNTALQNGGTGGGICGGVIDRSMKDTYELAYNNYVTRRGGSMPNTLAFLESRRPATEFRHILWETLTHAGLGMVGIP